MLGRNQDALNQGTPPPRYWMLIAVVVVILTAGISAVLMVTREKPPRPHVGTPPSQL
jgi:hypothetical protein